MSEAVSLSARRSCLGLVLAILAGCATGGGSSKTPTPSDAWISTGRGWSHRLVKEPVGAGQGGRQFALDLFKSQFTNEDLVVCPLGVQQLFQVLSEGATGKTKAQIDKAIYAKNNLASASQLLTELKRDVSLDVAQRIYVKPELQINPEFKTQAQQKFAVDISPRPDAKEINRWVSGTTHEQIKGVPSPAASSSLFPISLACLKSDWEKPFDPIRTSKRAFYSSGQSVMVPTMQTERTTLYSEQLGYRVLELPFKGERLVFDCILPTDRDGLQALEASLTRAKLDAALEALGRREMSVFLPRFHNELTLPVRDSAKKLGIRTSLSLRRLTPLPVELDGGSLATCLDVSERGAQAAPAAEVQGSPTPSSSSPVTTKFVADHPFMFLIRDRVSGAIVMIGRVVFPGRGGLGQQNATATPTPGQSSQPTLTPTPEQSSEPTPDETKESD